MARKILDLSHTLSPLEGELKDTLQTLCKTSYKADPLEASIEHFANKYGKIRFNSVDELLEASLAEAQYQVTQPVVSLGDALKDLLSV